MITGSFVNQDGGVHLAAVAMASGLVVDLVNKVNTVKVLVFHDLATAQVPVKPGQQPKTISQKSVVLRGPAFTTDPSAIDAYLMTQPAFTGWAEVPAAPAAKVTPAAVPAKK